MGEPTPDPTRRRNQARARMPGLSKTAATVEVAVLAGRGNRPHPSTPCGRPKRCRASVFPPIVHESGTARPDEFSSPGRGRAPGCPVGAGSRPPPSRVWRSWRTRPSRLPGATSSTTLRAETEADMTFKHLDKLLERFRDYPPEHSLYTRGRALKRKILNPKSSGWK